MKLAAFDDRRLRPTADRVKQRIFDILGPLGSEAIVLDLFAGTGSLGIEALSRGAAKAIFVEKDRRATRLIRQNLAKVEFTNKAEVIEDGVEQCLARVTLPGNLILADPPYHRGFAVRVLQQIEALELLKSGGYFVIEHETGLELEHETGFLLHSSRRVGDTTLSIFENEQSE